MYPVLQETFLTRVTFEFGTDDKIVHLYNRMLLFISSGYYYD